MKSIFFRIYGGALFSALLITAMLYAGFQLLNEQRLQQYLDKMAKGSFILIVQGIARHDGDNKEDWLEIIRTLTGLDLVLLGREASGLSASDWSRLKEGDLIINPDREQKSASLYIAVPGQENLILYTDSLDVNEKLSRVSALLILNELGRYERDERMDRMEEIRSDFGFPLTLKNTNETGLDFAQQRRVTRGDIVVILNDATSRSPYFEVLAKFGNSGKVLVLGAIPVFIWYPGGLVFLFSFFGLVAFALCCYLLVRPLERRLERMAAEVEKIGTPEASILSVEGKDFISQFGQKVNQMASRIQTLMGEQRELVHAISHELKTPVSRMKFRFEALTRKLEGVESFDEVVGISRDIGELDNLINELLTIAQIENNSIQLKSEAVNINELIDGVIDESSLLYPQVCITRGFEPSVQSVHCIEYLLKRAVQNLVLNASRYADSNVCVRFLSDESNYYLSVHDDGPGIPLEECQKIFKPFVRLDKSRDRASGGVGLGLAIVGQIAQVHGGSVVAQESMLGGAELCFQWPR